MKITRCLVVSKTDFLNMQRRMCIKHAMTNNSKNTKTVIPRYVLEGRY